MTNESQASVRRDTLEDLEARVERGDLLEPADVARVRDCADLIAVGRIGEAVRKRRHGNRVTWVRVYGLPDGSLPPGAISPTEVDAGEVRIGGEAGTLEEFSTRVRAARQVAVDRPVTGASLADLARWCDADADRMTQAATAIRGQGLDALAEAPLDRLGDRDQACRWIDAAARGGLPVWRATVVRGGADRRLALIAFAEGLQQSTGAFKAIAPLPTVDPHDEPSTGYDDVRTITLARLICQSIPSIQVDWSLYGPKLAQVALAYGADDLDGVPAIDELGLGWRRSPAADVERQIRAAFAEPVERDGRFAPRP